MYARDIEKIALSVHQKLPILTITGPRQSGKTTLCQALFPKHSYLSLEDPDLRRFALSDPKSLFNQYDSSLIIDEIQRAPELCSYLQGIVDQKNNKNTYVITGSHSQLLMEAVSQSLAGRCKVLELLPFSSHEILQFNKNISLPELLINGGYPRIYDKNIAPGSWLKDYFQLYVEKDARSIFNIKNLNQFETFTRLLAGRTGQLLNYESISNEVGASTTSIKQWLTVLETSYICYKLLPHFKNFNKRLTKSPKIYFHDTGLLCYLLKIQNEEQLETHPLRGQIFENFIINELIKAKLNKGEENNFYFWRDQKGHEVDLIEDNGQKLHPLEIKISKTFHSSFLKNIHYFNALQEYEKADLIYCGNPEQREEVKIQNWKNFLSIRNQ